MQEARKQPATQALGVAAPALGVLLAESVPLLLVVSWAIAVLLLTLVRIGPADSRPADDGWLRPEYGPLDEERNGVGSFVPPVRRTTAPPAVTVERATTLPDVDNLVGHTVATGELEDLLGPVLRAGKRKYARRWGAVLVHGPVVDATELVRAVAGDNGATLLAVRPARLAESRLGSAVEAVFVAARLHAPCVLLLSDVAAAGLDDEATRRRLHHDLLTQIRRLDTGDRVAVVGLVDEVDALPHSLRTAGGFDRTVGVGVLTDDERDRLLRREILLHAATISESDAAVQATAGLTAAGLRRVIADAVRLATARTGRPGGPVSVSARDVREGIAASTASHIILDAFGASTAQLLRNLVKELRQPGTGPALALLGAVGNGRTSAARWVTERCERRVIWLTGQDILALPPIDLHELLRHAVEHSALLVMDDIDFAFDAMSRRDQIRLVAVVERMLAVPGVGLMVTAEERWAPRWGDELDGRLRAWLLRNPSYHERKLLIRQRAPAAAEAEVGTLAAGLVSATRSAVVGAVIAGDVRRAS